MRVFSLYNKRNPSLSYVGNMRHVPLHKEISKVIRYLSYIPHKGARQTIVLVLKICISPQNINIYTDTHNNTYKELILFLIHSYLALVAGLTSEADYIFIPEDPAVTNWQEVLCNKLLQVLYFN